MRMSLAPRPADSVHRKRPLVVSAAPAGKLPSAVSLPTGASLRPFTWSLLLGPGSSARAAPTPIRAAKSARRRARRRKAWPSSHARRAARVAYSLTAEGRQHLAVAVVGEQLGGFVGLEPAQLVHLVVGGELAG